jgi:C4-dicarboxylate-specific signal transduction histidine kinase
MWETVLQTINLIGEDHRVRTIEHEVPLPGAGIGWVHWSTYVILTPEGTVAEFQAIGSDITDRKRAEEAQESLSHASRLAVVGELTAMIAHEVNQPLTAILHSAEAGVKLMRLKQPPMGEIETILTDIKEYDLRAGQSIRRLRDLLQKHEMEVQPLNLNEVALDVIRLIAGDAQRRRIEVENYLEPGLPLILGDRVHLQQLLLNLAMNGMQAMTDSPLGLRRLIVQTSRKEDSTVELSVYDSGHGIPGDLLPHVFESFFTTKKDGMGLGLSIAKSIVQKHNGNIRVDSNPRGGAVFRIGLPAIPDSDLMDKDATPEPGDPAALSRPLNRPERNGI